MKREHFSEPLTAYYNQWLSGHAHTTFILDKSEWEKVKAIADDHSNLNNSQFLARLLESNTSNGRHKSEHKVMFLDEEHDLLLNRWVEIIKAYTEIEIEKTVNRRLK